MRLLFHHCQSGVSGIGYSFLCPVLGLEGGNRPMDDFIIEIDEDSADSDGLNITAEFGAIFIRSKVVH